jgi:hypothetical protein
MRSKPASEVSDEKKKEEILSRMEVQTKRFFG